MRAVAACSRARFRSRRAPGVVYLLHGLGADTGTDPDSLVDTSAWISAALQRQPQSRVARALLAQRFA